MQHPLERVDKVCKFGFIEQSIDLCVILSGAVGGVEGSVLLGLLQGYYGLRLAKSRAAPGCSLARRCGGSLRLAYARSE